MSDDVRITKGRHWISNAWLHEARRVSQNMPLEHWTPPPPIIIDAKIVLSICGLAQ